MSSLIDRIVPSETNLSRPETDELRRLADVARDRGEWAEAARGYADYLRVQPDDAAIWIQLGHAMLQQNQLSDARDAYRHASRLRPDDADARVQMGRALRLTGAEAQSIQEFRRALQLAPSKDAYRELLGVGELELARSLMARWEEVGSSDTVYLEVNDLFCFLRVHRTLTGIQRVMVNILEQLLSLPSDDGARFRFVTGTAEEPLRLVDGASLDRLLRYASSEKVDQDHLRGLIEKCEAGAQTAKPLAGQTYLALGAFWAVPDFHLRCAWMKEAGLRVGVYLYDLIPITHREFCEASLSWYFSLALGDALLNFDFVLAISEHTAGEVRTLLDQVGLSAMPVRTLPLAHTLKPPQPGAPRWSPAIRFLRDTRFVLSVSTIEVRKNHAYLFRAWREMIQAGEDVPDLVIVGRPGWRVNDLMAQFRDTDYLDGRIHVLHGLTDDDLATLYRSCLFTAFPSFTEGWGLPVGESLAYGTPCVASQVASIPEVGGDLIHYIDPHNLQSGLETIRRLVSEPEHLEESRRKIAQRFRPRTWEAVTTELLSLLDELTGDDSTVNPPRVPELISAEVFEPSELRAGQPPRRDYLQRPLRAIMAARWYDAENFGAWMHGEEGRLRFRASGVGRKPVIVYLQMTGAPHVEEHHLTVSAWEHSHRRATAKVDNPRLRKVRLHPNAPVTIRILAEPGPDDVVDLRLQIDREVGHFQQDPRRMIVGLMRLGWARADDAVARQEVTERFLLDPLRS
ncbi:glycosyltransferase family 4 protein [Roseomonas elaeocarpi]|uniref:Glycosyltransferase n=1 Tax=Roseomonas elaeocarpi TaxID=907779 RepID=A0ABV6JYP1_9PROT